MLTENQQYILRYKWDKVEMQQRLLSLLHAVMEQPNFTRSDVMLDLLGILSYLEEGDYDILPIRDHVEKMIEKEEEERQKNIEKGVLT